MTSDSVAQNSENRPSSTEILPPLVCALDVFHQGSKLYYPFERHNDDHTNRLRVEYTRGLNGHIYAHYFLLSDGVEEPVDYYARKLGASLRPYRNRCNRVIRGHQSVDSLFQPLLSYSPAGRPSVSRAWKLALSLGRVRSGDMVPSVRSGDVVPMEAVDLVEVWGCYMEE